MKNINNLFVYGTLQKGRQHESLLKKLKGSWKKGYVNGKLFNIKSGENYGYPALKLNKKGSKIFGMIFQSKELKKNLKKIDQFEGVDYKRVISKINNVNDGKKTDSYIYVIK